MPFLFEIGNLNGLYSYMRKMLFQSRLLLLNGNQLTLIGRHNAPGF